MSRGPQHGPYGAWPPRPQAALLLEVVVAMTVLVASLGLLAAQLARSLEMTTYAAEQVRVSLLTDRLLGLVEFDPNVQRRIAEAGLEWAEDAFGQDCPGYFWRVKAEPVNPDDPNSADLGLVTLQVLQQPDREHPESIDGTRVVRQLAFLKAKPAQIDLQQMGLTGEGLAQLGVPAEVAAQLPELLSLLGGFESSQVSIQQIVQALDPQTLQMLMPMIQAFLAQAGGGGEELAGGLASLMGQLGGGEPGGPTNMPPAAAGGGVPGAAPGPAAGLPGAAAGPRRPGPVAGTPRAGGPPNRPGTPPGGVPANPPPGGGAGAAPLPVQGSGPNGEYTIEDLMRLRDEMARQEAAGR